MLMKLQMDWFADNRYEMLCKEWYEWKEIPDKKMFEVEERDTRRRG
jgi:hypothetical protein